MALRVAFPAPRAIAVTSLLWLACFSPVDVIAEPKTRADIQELEALANDGSFDAMLKLGLAYDLGTGVQADRGMALDWYLQAAEAGDPDGQFNAAVMMDAGLVTGADDPQISLHWYTRAAANGQARAQYNLGLIYANGDGVDANPAVARHWFTKAAEQLPAAEAKLASIPTDAPDADLSAPIQPIGALVEIDTGRFAELTWIAPPGPADSFFEVEILAWSNDLSTWSQPVFEGRTDGNGIVTALDANTGPFAWRVAMVVPSPLDARSSDWVPLGEGTQGLPNDTPFQATTGRSGEGSTNPYGVILDRVRNIMDEAPSN